VPIPRAIPKRLRALVGEGAQVFQGSFEVVASPPNETFFSLFFLANPNEVQEQNWAGADNVFGFNGNWNGTAVYIYLPLVVGGLPGRFHTVSVWVSQTAFGAFRQFDFETCGTQQPFCKQFWLPTPGLGARMLVRLDCENFQPFPLVQEYCVVLREYWPTFRTIDPFPPGP